MNRKIVDSAIRSQLDDLGTELEFCDEAGRTLGYFVPVPDRERELYDWAKGEFTDAEIERAREEPGGLTIDEMLYGLTQ